MYDVEAYLDERKALSPTTSPIETEHTPISVSLGDTLNSSTHLCNADSNQLVEDFVDELRRQGDQIREVVRQRYLLDDLEFLPTKQKNLIQERCDQLPVLGFSSGKYDLNLIKEYFVDKITDTAKKIKVAKKANQTMFLLTPHFRFLNVMKYLGPGTSYENGSKPMDVNCRRAVFSTSVSTIPKNCNTLST